MHKVTKSTGSGRGTRSDDIYWAHEWDIGHRVRCWIYWTVIFFVWMPMGIMVWAGVTYMIEDQGEFENLGMVECEITGSRVKATTTYDKQIWITNKGERESCTEGKDPGDRTCTSKTVYWRDITQTTNAPCTEWEVEVQYTATNGEICDVWVSPLSFYDTDNVMESYHNYDCGGGEHQCNNEVCEMVCRYKTLHDLYCEIFEILPNTMAACRRFDWGSEVTCDRKPEILLPKGWARYKLDYPDRTRLLQNGTSIPATGLNYTTLGEFTCDENLRRDGCYESLNKCEWGPHCEVKRRCRETT